MTDKRKLMLIVGMTLARHEALHLTIEAVRWINKHGGEYQRSEGLKKLDRIQKYLLSTSNVIWEDSRNDPDGKFIR